MSFPTVGQTATAAITTTGVLGVGSFYAASRSESTTNTVALGLLGIGCSALNIGFISAYMRSNATTTPKQYLKNGVSDTGPVIATGATIAVQTTAKAVLDGVSGAIRDNIYDCVRGVPKKDDPDSKK